MCVARLATESVKHISVFLVNNNCVAVSLKFSHRIPCREAKISETGGGKKYRKKEKKKKKKKEKKENGREENR